MDEVTRSLRWSEAIVGAWLLVVCTSGGGLPYVEAFTGRADTLGADWSPSLCGEPGVARASIAAVRRPSR